MRGFLSKGVIEIFRITFVRRFLSKGVIEIFREKLWSMVSRKGVIQIFRRSWGTRYCATASFGGSGRSLSRFGDLLFTLLFDANIPRPEMSRISMHRCCEDFYYT